MIGWNGRDGILSDLLVFTVRHTLGLLIAIDLLEEEKGCRADMADFWVRTPLMWAAEGGHEEMVKLLLYRRDVETDSRDKGDRTPLWRASLGGYEGVVKLLLGRKEVNPDSRDCRGQTPLQHATGTS